MARSRAVMAAAMIGNGANLERGEAYCRQVIANGEDPERLPSTYATLAESLQAQGRYEEAATAARTVTETYPYSTWASYAALIQADCTYSLGKKAEALELADEMIRLYPNTDYAEAAKRRKEIAWR